ncbi:hypothetical protein JOF53_005562 [Crossiella equi]|uniref:Secreted protein n=1 Tax=Crossiella equi TaxID=130796 RepID=A0ABS5AJE0_9PSEU|nr:hypothetical protein [Crossiella equi]MBP2476690.1 hypothetical protein [Crossiella equi]
MSIAKKVVATTTMAAAALGTAIVGATPASAGVISIQGVCGDTKSPSVGGGAAGWTITCQGGVMRVIGWVKDTDADGKAAEVYGTWGNGDSFGVVRAGGEGTRKNFDKSKRGVSSVSLYLRVI